MKWYWIPITALTILIGSVMIANAEQFTPDEIVKAIGRVENSVKYPFGVQSIDTKGKKEYARKICKQSVINAYKRWIEADKPECFLLFMGRRYCPPNYINWSEMVKYWLIRYRKELNEL